MLSQSNVDSEWERDSEVKGRGKERTLRGGVRGEGEGLGGEGQGKGKGE